MLLKEPFYAHFLSGIIREVTDKVPTAAVGFKSGKIALYVNKNFFLKELRSITERVAVIKHETLHIIFKHLFRMKTKNWQIPKNKLALEIKNLTKTYQGESEYYALDDVSLNVKAGSIFGLLGPNGAGKSTLINIISGIVFKSSGDVSVWGMDIEKERKQSKLAVGIVPQELNIDAFFTPDELLDLHSGMFNVPKALRKTKELLKLILMVKTFFGSFRKRKTKKMKILMIGLGEERH